MKKVKSLLGFIVSFIAIFMLGFMTVNADDINLVSGKKFFEGAISPVNGGKRDFHLKQVVGNNSAYAFCLDSQHVFYEGEYNSNSNLSYDSKKIENVILNAYLTGLGTDKNVYGISNDELYEITQMAVWYASHGTGTDGMLENDTYINWLNQKGYEYRKTIYNELRTVVSDISKPSINIKSSQGGNKEFLTPSAKKDYFESSRFMIDGPENLVYTVSVDSKQSSKGACVLYNGNCKKSQQISVGDEFSLIANYVSNQDVTVVATVTSSDYLTGYTFNLYQPEVIANNQNAAVFIPTFGKYEGKISATGRDDVKKNIPSNLTISKKDLTTGREVNDAYLQIFQIVNGEREDKPIYEWISNGKDYVINDIKPGKYVLIEVLPNPNYEADMIIGGNKMSEYKFDILEGQNTKIEVYNELKAEKVDVPNTGVNSASTYIIGAFVILIGAGTVVVARKKEFI